ncbi:MULTISPECIES: helix-turn-helix domain-containing protein [Streptomyces]|uniref:XRE family transcriptional regulator n=5 Tax=Streptomyces violaceusniger group TaxID=2839105 RepID=A0ABN1SI40_9ACTN|nr:MULTISPECIES: XRE family transcriptional regulator [Streptomyces]MBA6433456.1 helix-turn-helix transcriptional regulator [Streptomyces sp. GMR22]MBI0312231.1 helix-turn-helix transcriptional regulator [Streptomyces javensis]MBI0374926.1 helix-turn-helix transcriptional regulator [Streptomyces albiflaviniger]NEW69334.1 helix-turn-helix domain-containing protein [Streptomyces rhizosphaericus]
MSSSNAGDKDNRPDADASIASLGEQIRSLRKHLGLTLEELSSRSNVSTGLISLLERGKGNPSFASLIQLAHGLDVPIGRLFHGETPASPVVRAKERRTLEWHGNEKLDGARYQLLTPSLKGALEVVWVETEPGHDTSGTPFRHNGEEFGIVLSGVKDVFLDGVRHRLEAGDSITYSSSIPHWYVAVGDEPSTAIWVITPPTW